MEEQNLTYSKFVEVQSEIKARKSKFNSFGRYNYRSCEDILEAAKPILHKYGLFLTLSDEVISVGNHYYIKATARLSDGVNSIETSAVARESDNKKGMDDSQITGTASSYARKYALNGLFCLDDAKDADTDEYQAKALNDACNRISNANTIEEMQQAWSDNKSFQKTPQFIAAKDAGKQRLSMTANQLKQEMNK